MNIGDKIRGVRLMKGLSQENLADMLGISLLAYGDIERNKKDVTIKRIEQIAEKLGIGISDILSYGDAVSNFFDQCSNTSINTGNSKKNKNIETHYDQRELLHKLEVHKMKTEKLAIEIEKLNAQKEKAELEAKYWKEKCDQTQG
jgi:transcriptional regulator with XRE-family HTH domain